MKSPVLKILLLVLAITAALSPLAQLLRTQNAWSCFQLTFDESYFIQAIKNWAEGRGYRLHSQAEVFDPGITVGIPVAWGTTLFQRLTNVEWTLAGRIFVHACFYSLLTLGAVVAYRRSRSAWGSVIFLSLLGVLISAAPAASYTTFGILGEIPGALIAWISLLVLSSRYFALSGMIAVLCYATKPSYIFLIPAVSLSAVIFYQKKGLWTGLMAFISGAAYLFTVATARHESLPQYVQQLVTISRSISLHNTGTLLDYYRDAGWITAMISILIISSGLMVLIGKKSHRSEAAIQAELTPSTFASAFFFVTGCALYILSSTAPVPKQWFVFYGLAAGMLSLKVAITLGQRLGRSSAFSPEVVLASACAAILTWLINIPGSHARNYSRTPVEGCPVKEQRYVDQELVKLSREGKLKPGDLGGVLQESWMLFPYEYDQPVSYFPNWKALQDRNDRTPQWVFGDLPTLFPAPINCREHWKGKALAILRCS